MTNALYQKLTHNYGSITCDGAEYLLLQNAYITGPLGAPYFEALAIKASDTPDEDGCVPVYDLTWYPYTSWLDDPDAQMDEGDACDWDNPDFIESAACYYDLATARIA